MTFLRLWRVRRVWSFGTKQYESWLRSQYLPSEACQSCSRARSRGATERLLRARRTCGAFCPTRVPPTGSQLEATRRFTLTSVRGFTLNFHGACMEGMVPGRGGEAAER